MFVLVMIVLIVYKNLLMIMFVKGTVKDIVAVKGNEHCSDMGGLYIYIYYHGKTVRYEYDWGQIGVKYSSEFDELLNLLKVHDAE